MNIIPAIDLSDNKVVRLQQGRMDLKSVYGSDPVAMAHCFEDQGFTDLHIVDLDAAMGKEPQLSTITNIVNATSLAVQLGGGIRSQARLESILRLKLKRVVIGTLCVTEIDLVKSWLLKYGTDRITLAMDLNIPYVAIAGWQEVTTTTAQQLLSEYAEFDNLVILCTDIARDGMLSGPNIQLYQTLMTDFPQFIIQASGGIRNINDINALKQANIRSCIIGKALYENTTLGGIPC